MKISRSLFAELEKNNFAGQLIGAHDQVCNYASADSRVVSLVKPELGMGPFSLMLPSGTWPGRAPEEIWLDANNLQLMGETIALNSAHIWEPMVVWPEFDPASFKLFRSALLRFAYWGVVDKQPKALANALLRQAANLLAALAAGTEINEAIGMIVGLGNGLTPAGDDYLLGCLAALQYSYSDLAKQIKLPATLPTTQLSGAFLRAAVKGEFLQPWHDLAEAIRFEDKIAFRQAVDQIAQSGATSGIDALTGFTQTLVLIAE